MGRRVLIVDDDETMAGMLVEALGERGWSARGATGLAEALRALETDACSAVVSDIQMAGGGGFELLHVVRSGRRPLPVILMSSFGTPETERQAREAGAFAFLAKPFELRRLVDLLETIHAPASSTERRTEEG